METVGSALLAFLAPLFGTSSDEGSEALPDSSGSDSSSELANGGTTAPMKY